MVRDILVVAVMVVGVNGARGGDVAQVKSAGGESNVGVGTPPVPAALVAEAARMQYWFGVAVENIPPVIAKQLKLQADQGLLVVAVLPNSPAERAGLKADDLLIELDGEAVTSQEDLARAANASGAAKKMEGKGGGVKACRITYLREGDRCSVEVMPVLRPMNMLVMGANVGNFVVGAKDGAEVAGAGASGGGNGVMARNIVLPNGKAAQVGPGYQLDLRGENSTVQSIRKIVAQGQTVVLTQETDAAGAMRNRITVGDKSYAVEAGKVESLPAEVRPLAEQLLANTSQGQGAATGGNGVAGAGGGQEMLERRLDDLQKQNEELTKQVMELTRVVKEKMEGGTGAGK